MSKDVGTGFIMYNRWNADPQAKTKKEIENEKAVSGREEIREGKNYGGGGGVLENSFFTKIKLTIQNKIVFYQKKIICRSYFLPSCAHIAGCKDHELERRIKGFFYTVYI
jgi:hypothetical protein